MLLNSIQVDLSENEASPKHSHLAKCQPTGSQFERVGRISRNGLAGLHRTGTTRRVSADRVRKCIRILQLLEAAAKPEDVDIVGLHFHSLQGAPKRWSVRVTANYRVTFGWSGEAAVDIDLEDYH